MSDDEASTWSSVPEMLFSTMLTTDNITVSSKSEEVKPEISSAMFIIGLVSLGLIAYGVFRVILWFLKLMHALFVPKPVVATPVNIDGNRPKIQDDYDFDSDATDFTRVSYTDLTEAEARSNLRYVQRRLESAQNHLYVINRAIKDNTIALKASERELADLKRYASQDIWNNVLEGQIAVQQSDVSGKQLALESNRNLMVNARADVDRLEFDVKEARNELSRLIAKESKRRLRETSVVTSVESEASPSWVSLTESEDDGASFRLETASEFEDADSDGDPFRGLDETLVDEGLSAAALNDL